MTIRPPPLTRREVMLAVGVVAFVFIQALIPALVPREPDRQVEYAWELYSKGAPRRTFEVVVDTGSTSFVPSESLPFYDAVIDYTTDLPPWLCDRYDAERIDVTVGSEQTSRPCR